VREKGISGEFWYLLRFKFSISSPQISLNPFRYLLVDSLYRFGIAKSGIWRVRGVEWYQNESGRRKFLNWFKSA